ncbi:MAG: hypothetical protein PHC70_00665 [Patescibacteria group bacterium]|nr:hypothetical protein [Patescibacteria group bacterium]
MSDSAKTEKTVREVKKQPLHLYWCTTDDHAEAWFVVARTSRIAAKIFADYEGYLTKEIDAELVMDVPEKFQSSEEWYASHELIEGCGGTITESGSRRAVALNGHLFTEGPMQSIIDEGMKNLGWDPYANHGVSAE